MSDGWIHYVGRGVRPVVVPWEHAALFADARHRVLHSPKMREYMGIIFDPAADWTTDETHLRWVLSGKVGEITEWAKAIAKH